MSRIPLHTKVSLLNNYIQTNYLKSRGKAEHDEWPISKVLESIIEDLNTLEKQKSQTAEELPTGSMVRDLKFLQDKQKSIRVAIDTISEELKTIKEHYSDPTSNLDSVIKTLEDFSKK